MKNPYLGAFLIVLTLLSIAAVFWAWYRSWHAGSFDASEYLLGTVAVGVVGTSSFALYKLVTQPVSRR